MNESIPPRLRADVLLRPFEQFEGDERFIVAVDDRHFVVSPLVAAILEESRSTGTLAALAARASTRLGANVSAETASRVLSDSMLSVCFHATEMRASDGGPIRFRQRLLSARALSPLLAMARPLFSRGNVGMLVTLLVLIEALVASRAHAAAPASLTSAEVVCVATLTALGIIVHELGHLTACSRYGAQHGGIGVGLYWCMPVFYAEVNGAWMLPRLQRAVVDIGGLYFQCCYVVTLGALYLLTDRPWIVHAMTWTHVLMLHTLNPVLKFDGYWLLSDLAGFPNLHAAIREIARRTWIAIVNGLALPSGALLLLLGTFIVLAAAYFGYVFVVLGENIGQSLGASLQGWSTHAPTWDAIWRAIGDSALLALFVVMALSVALLFARSLYVLFARPVDRIGKDSSQ